MCHISWLKALPCAIPQNLTLIDFEADRRSCLTYIFTYFVTRKHDVSIQSDPVRELEPLCNHSYTATQGTYYVSSAQPLFQIYTLLASPPPPGLTRLVLRSPVGKNEERGFWYPENGVTDLMGLDSLDPAFAITFVQIYNNVTANLPIEFYSISRPQVELRADGDKVVAIKVTNVP